MSPAKLDFVATTSNSTCQSQATSLMIISSDSMMPHKIQAMKNTSTGIWN